MRNIIITVDKHGLKRRNLNKHKKDVSRFYDKILNYDGVPWNNNNAEHAIKHFAKFRRIMKHGGNFTKKGLRDYLVLLSIYQTCRYKGINFMKFLASKEKSIYSAPRKCIGSLGSEG